MGPFPLVNLVLMAFPYGASPATPPRCATLALVTTWPWCTAREGSLPQGGQLNTVIMYEWWPGRQPARRTALIEGLAQAATSLFAQTFQQINSSEFTKLDSF